jgi:hypothetical protein
MEIANFVLSWNTPNSAYDPAPFQCTALSEIEQEPLYRLKTYSSTCKCNVGVMSMVKVMVVAMMVVMVMVVMMVVMTVLVITK